jgi:hypothetical protein
MAKILIEAALVEAITNSNLHAVTLCNGLNSQRENAFTGAMAPLIPCWPQVNTYNNYIIDLVKIDIEAQPPIITKGLLPQVEWALEAKHYSPHQPNYIENSLAGPMNDLLKLTQCRFNRFYILQLQTEVVDFTINMDSNYAAFTLEFPFMNYLSNATEAQARANIGNVGLSPNSRIDELIANSRLILDQNLVYDNMQDTVEGDTGSVKVKIHYLISGPFESNEIINSVHIASNPDE